MSGREELNLSKIVYYFFGIIICSLGIMLTYFSTTATTGAVDPSMFTPIGLFVSLLGGLILINKED